MYYADYRNVYKVHCSTCHQYVGSHSGGMLQCYIHIVVMTHCSTTCTQVSSHSPWPAIMTVDIDQFLLSMVAIFCH